MSDYQKALAAAREAHGFALFNDSVRAKHACFEALHDLLAAIDAQKPVALPETAFRLTWRNGQYRVSKPNIGDTDCYTAEQVRAILAAAREKESNRE